MATQFKAAQVLAAHHPIGILISVCMFISIALDIADFQTQAVAFVIH